MRLADLEHLLKILEKRVVHLEDTQGEILKELLEHTHKASEPNSDT